MRVKGLEYKTFGAYHIISTLHCKKGQEEIELNSSGGLLGYVGESLALVTISDHCH